MPGLCGFITQGRESPRDSLQTMLEGLKHHPTHHALAGFCDHQIAIGLVLRQAGLGGIHWQGSDGTQVWVDGEAFDDRGPMPGEELAEQLASGTLRVWNGTFAAVVYDPSAGKLHFITDPYGLKYLYVRTEGAPAWSGESRGFLNLPGDPLRFNETCLRQFLEHGYPLGGTTWFSGVQLLGPGMRLTYDLKSGQWASEKYFSPENKPASGTPSWDDTVSELGLLFRKAVIRRCSNDARLGLTLSGGLDSRALLAVIPQNSPAPETLTFGKPGCADEAIAKAAAAVRGAPHTFIPMGGENWLEMRAEGVIHTDGHINILDLHGMESFPALEERMDVCLNGFLGDGLLGGRWTASPNRGSGDAASRFMTRYIDRGRRFILQSLHNGGTSLVYRLPFLDVPLMEKTLSLPNSWLQHSRIYRAMLLREFPEFFHSLPWEKTGLPISAAPWRERWAIKMRGLRRRLRIGNDGYADYPQWLREGSAADFLRAQLNPDSRINRFLAPGELENCLRRHFRGIDESAMLGRYLTAEIWLQFLQARNVSYEN